MLNYFVRPRLPVTCWLHLHSLSRAPCVVCHELPCESAWSSWRSCLHTYLHTYIHTHRMAGVPGAAVRIHTCIHTHTHTHTHTEWLEFLAQLYERPVPKLSDARATEQMKNAVAELWKPKGWAIQVPRCCCQCCSCVAANFTVSIAVLFAVSVAASVAVSVAARHWCNATHTYKHTHTHTDMAKAPYALCGPVGWTSRVSLLFICICTYMYTCVYDSRKYFSGCLAAPHSLYVCMHVCMHACMHVCMYVLLCVDLALA